MAENFMRSAKAPVISAGVMIAKVIWKVMNTDSGMVPLRESLPMPARNRFPSPPTKALRSPPSLKASEYPMTIHSTVIRQAVAKLCMTVDSTFFLRTMPP